jgi:hypothetical protein
MKLAIITLRTTNKPAIVNEKDDRKDTEFVFNTIVEWRRKQDQPIMHHLHHETSEEAIQALYKHFLIKRREKI